ncbi:MOSC domain-containing protein [Pseudonocardia sp. GCM10023141]|uniref:MOSC domain-containing protein n=1 Tax=Pseudonocardia sp. GCM10023141 TaxID=3252653 RepID=UPI00360D37AB
MHVVDLGIVPVKGTRYVQVGAVDLDRSGVVGDRAFLVVAAADSGLLITGRTPALQRVRSRWLPERGLLRLEFPDGTVVTDRPQPGEHTTTRMYDGRELTGRLADGPAAAALSEFLGRPVRLVQPDAGARGADDAPVTLVSEASLATVASETGTAHLDPRRFRMTMTVSGAASWEEESWLGREVVVGETTLRVGRPVVRCVVTTRNPESAVVDARVLHALARLRGHTDLCLGVWCEVVEPGRVRRGDPLRLGPLPPPT